MKIKPKSVLTIYLQQDPSYAHTVLRAYAFSSDAIRLANGPCATLFSTVYAAFCKSQRLGATLFITTTKVCAHDKKRVRS